MVEKKEISKIELINLVVGCMADFYLFDEVTDKESFTLKEIETSIKSRVDDAVKFFDKIGVVEEPKKVMCEKCNLEMQFDEIKNHWECKKCKAMKIKMNFISDDLQNKIRWRINELIKDEK